MEQASYTVFTARGWGSAIAEALLAMCGASMQFAEVRGFDRPGEARDRLLRVNPLGQLPTLLLPEGTVMTESAAIALLLAERYPQAGLAPAPGSALRPLFLRRLVWIVTNVYPTFTYGYSPERWVVGADARSLRSATDAHREQLWREFEADVRDGGWALGSLCSALDVFVAVMTHWGPDRAWFAEHCPRLRAIADHADAHPVIGPVLARNFRSAR
jgi:GST-like protein